MSYTPESPAQIPPANPPDAPVPGQGRRDEELQSRVINALRFPLIVGVLLIHTRVIPKDTSGIFYYLETLLSRIVGHISVPLFFFISGYLFFYKMEFSAASYLSKIQKRAKSLLFPYVFWISVWIIAYFALVKTGAIWAGRPANWPFFIHAFWDIEGDSEGTRPFIGQFWFLRDLMCAVLISPLTYLGIRKIAWFFVVILGVLWLLEGQQGGGGVRIPFIGERGLSLWVLFFFSAGAWFSVNKKNWTAIFSRWKTFSFVVYPVLVVLDLFTQQSEWNWLIHRIGIFAGVFFVVNWTTIRLSRFRGDAPTKSCASANSVSSFLFSASFFVYATHGPGLLLALNKLIIVPLKPQSDGALIVCYFLFLIIELAVTLTFYWILRRFFPNFTRIITGGRGG